MIGAAFSSLFSGAAFLTSLAFAVAKGVAVYLIRSLFADDPEPPPQPQTNFVQAVSASQYVFGYSRITPPLVFAGRAVDSEATTEDLDALFSGDTSKTLGFEFRFSNHGNMVCVYALSEGAAGIEGIERMWSNNVEVPLKLHATTTTYKHYVSEAPYRDTNPGKGYPTIMAYVIPAATRTGSAATKSALSAVMRKLYPNKWTTDHGLPMAHMVVIYKPTANNRRTDDTPERSKEACLVNGVPKLEVLLKGMKLALPTDADGTLAAATWTRNAADIRWWFETHIRGRTVNYASYAAAKTICGQTVNPPGSPVASTPTLDRLRYAADGVFRANDDLDAVGAQLDRCWQGFAALRNGEWHFYPGSNRAVATTIDAADVIRVERTQLGAGIRDRYNQISASMQQSANADWQQTSLPLLIDGDAKTADGGLPLELKWGTLGYVIDPYQAVRCMRLALRRGRRTNLYQVTCVPGVMMVNAELHPGDVVTFNHPLIHAINQRCVILNSTINPDMSVSLQLLREDSTVYTAAITDAPFDASGELSLNSVDNNREQELIDTITANPAKRDASLGTDGDGNNNNVMAVATTVLWFRQPGGPAVNFEWRDSADPMSAWTRNASKLRWYYTRVDGTDDELIPLTDEAGNQHTLASLAMPLAPTTYSGVEGDTATVVTGVSLSVSGGTLNDEGGVTPAKGTASVTRTDVIDELDVSEKIRHYVLGVLLTDLTPPIATLTMRPLDSEDDYGNPWLGTVTHGSIDQPGTLDISGEMREDSTSTFDFPETFGSAPVTPDDSTGGTDEVSAGLRVAVFDQGIALSWDNSGSAGSWFTTVNDNTDWTATRGQRGLIITNETFGNDWECTNGVEYTIKIGRGGRSLDNPIYMAKATPGYVPDGDLIVTPGDGELELEWSHPQISGSARSWAVIVDGVSVATRRRSSNGYTATGLVNGKEHKLAVVSLGSQNTVALDQRATPTAADAPIVPHATNIMARSASIVWDDSAAATGWTIRIEATSGLSWLTVRPGGATSRAQGVDPTSPSAFTGLRPSQEYQVTISLNGTEKFRFRFETTA